MILIKTFLIQTVAGKVVHDFAFALIEAINYNNWYYNTNTYEYILSDTTNRPQLNPIQYYSLEHVVPIGTVEFVLEFIKRHHNIDNVRPINIPLELRKPEYTKRWVEISEHSIIKGKNIIQHIRTSPIFVKDNIKIKGYCNIVQPDTQVPQGEFLVSEFIDIESEWRAFIYEKQLVGLQNYSDDFTIFPDVQLIRQMIEDYKNCPPAYTLDVGINKTKGSFIIEVHSFFSCGLYGFGNNKLLPQMFIRSFNQIIKGESL